MNEAVQQIASADRIIVNKTDLVEPDELATVIATVRAINGEAPLVQTVRDWAHLPFIVSTAVIHVVPLQLSVLRNGGADGWRPRVASSLTTPTHPPPTHTRVH